jgi:hypothetical protein
MQIEEINQLEKAEKMLQSEEIRDRYIAISSLARLNTK